MRVQNSSIRIKAICIGLVAPMIAPSAAVAAPEWPKTLPPQFWLGALLFLALLGFFLGYLVPKTNIVRDQGPDPGPSTFKTYSLARCQMALWFFVVLGSYLAIYLTMGNADFSRTTLILMGISFGTTALAKTVDAGKVAQAQTKQDSIAPPLAEAKAELQKLGAISSPSADDEAQLAAAEARIVDLQKQLNVAQQAAMPQQSQAIVPDLMTDDGGASLHRFQMVIWTIVLATMFIHDVCFTPSMPQFPDTLLGLMGISNGVYVGLKIQEK